MSDINIFTMPLNELIEMEKKVWVKYYDLNNTIQKNEGYVKDALSSCTNTLFKAGTYPYGTYPDSDLWVPCTNSNKFYEVCEYELLNGKPSPGNSNKTTISKTSSYFTLINKFKSYLTGFNYDINDSKTSSRNTLLIENINKTVSYFNEFSNKIMAKYSIYGSPKFIFSSTYRSAVNNIRGGSTVVSQHLAGMAVDVRFLGMTSNLMVRFLYDTGNLARVASPGLQTKCYPKLTSISGGSLSKDAFPRKFGIYYEPWMSDILKLNELTDTNETVRKKLKPFVSYTEGQLKEDTPVNELQLKCINAKTINPIGWMHIGFIGMDIISPDEKFKSSGVKLSNTEYNTYIVFKGTTKSGEKILQNTDVQLSGDGFDRSIYYDQIMGLEE